MTNENSRSLRKPEHCCHRLEMVLSMDYVRWFTKLTQIVNHWNGRALKLSGHRSKIGTKRDRIVPSSNKSDCQIANV